VVVAGTPEVSVFGATGDLPAVAEGGSGKGTLVEAAFSTASPAEAGSCVSGIGTAVSGDISASVCGRVVAGMTIGGTSFTGGTGSDWIDLLAASAGIGGGLMRSGVPVGAKRGMGMKCRLMSTIRSVINKVRLR
jgi:hypothetical protein